MLLIRLTPTISKQESSVHLKDTNIKGKHTQVVFFTKYDKLWHINNVEWHVFGSADFTYTPKAESVWGTPGTFQMYMRLMFFSRLKWMLWGFCECVSMRAFVLLVSVCVHLCVCVCQNNNPLKVDWTGCNLTVKCWNWKNYSSLSWIAGR